jgi:hypothetical protein
VTPDGIQELRVRASLISRVWLVRSLCFSNALFGKRHEQKHEECHAHMDQPLPRYLQFGASS